MNKIIALLVLVSLTLADAQETFPKLSKSFWGIELGEKDSSFEQKCSESGITIHKNKWSMTDKTHPAVIWSIDGTLNRKEEIKETIVYLFNGQIYMIVLKFAEYSDDNYDALAKALSEKYEDAPNMLSNSLNEVVKTTIDEQEVKIMVENNFRAEKSIKLYYVYKSLNEKVREVFLKEKASKLLNDL